MCIRDRGKYFQAVHHEFADGLLIGVAANIIFYRGYKISFVLYATLIVKEDHIRVYGLIEIVKVT